MLEADRSGRRWKTSINAYPAAQDLFIESLVFAGNSQELISSIWSVLIEDEGHFLKIFLKRFQYVASIPNPQYTMLAGQMYTSLGEVRTWERIPLWMYWLGILYVFVTYLDDLLRLVPIETARLFLEAGYGTRREIGRDGIRQPRLRLPLRNRQYKQINIIVQRTMVKSPIKHFSKHIRISRMRSVTCCSRLQHEEFPQKKMVLLLKITKHQAR